MASFSLVRVGLVLLRIRNHSWRSQAFPRADRSMPAGARLTQTTACRRGPAGDAHRENGASDRVHSALMGQLGRAAECLGCLLARPVRVQLVGVVGDHEPLSGGITGVLPRLRGG